MTINFIGGMHGAGKTMVAKYIADETKSKLLVASEVLKWHQTQNPRYKQVQNIKHNQHQLLKTLKRIIEPNKSYLIEGHYCLLDSNKKIQRVPENLFKFLGLNALFIKVAKTEDIHKRLLDRDGINWDKDLIRQMQIEEYNYAIELSKKLNIPFNLISDYTPENTIKTIAASLQRQRS